MKAKVGIILDRSSLIVISTLGWAVAWCIAWSIGWYIRFLLAESVGFTMASVIGGAVGGAIAGGLGAAIMVKQFNRSPIDINLPGTIVIVWTIALMLDWPLGFTISYKGSSSGPEPYGPVGLVSGLIGGFFTNLLYKKSNINSDDSRTSAFIIIGGFISLFLAGYITWGMAFKETFFVLTGNSNNYMAMLIGPFLGGGVGGLLLTLTINRNIVKEVNARLIAITIGMVTGTITATLASAYETWYTGNSKSFQQFLVFIIWELIFSVAGALIGQSSRGTKDAIWVFSIIGSFLPILANFVLLMLFMFFFGQ